MIKKAAKVTLKVCKTTIKSGISIAKKTQTKPLHGPCLSLEAVC